MLPDKYLPVIRDSGHTWRLTEVMISKVFPEVESLEQLPDNFKISLNIFPHDVLTGEVNKLVSIPALTNSRFNTVIEITEDEYLDAESARANLQALYQSGIQISIDDFGTGYSNLKQLKKINCHFLKIDRSFVMEIEEDSIKSSLIPHVVNIAAQLNLKVIAEGIENTNQQQVLAGLGVKYGQGWVFGKPVSAPELAQMIASRNPAFIA
jgi:sensor c-di-GMP phosphodiesterase-like protein